jgi:hypothetical protein
MDGYEGEGKHGNNSALIGAMGGGRRGFQGSRMQMAHTGRGLYN